MGIEMVVDDTLDLVPELAGGWLKGIVLETVGMVASWLSGKRRVPVVCLKLTSRLGIIVVLASKIRVNVAVTFELLLVLLASSGLIALTKVAFESCVTSDKLLANGVSFGLIVLRVGACVVVVLVVVVVVVVVVVLVVVVVKRFLM